MLSPSFWTIRIRRRAVYLPVFLSLLPIAKLVSGCHTPQSSSWPTDTLEALEWPHGSVGRQPVSRLDNRHRRRQYEVLEVSKGVPPHCVDSRSQPCSRSLS